MVERNVARKARGDDQIFAMPTNVRRSSARVNAARVCSYSDGDCFQISAILSSRFWSASRSAVRVNPWESKAYFRFVGSGASVACINSFPRTLLQVQLMTSSDIIASTRNVLCSICARRIKRAKPTSGERLSMRIVMSAKPLQCFGHNCLTIRLA
jgi:hypothetical protein